MSYTSLVGVAGLEPAASWSQTTRAAFCAKLRWCVIEVSILVSPAYQAGAFAAKLITHILVASE